MPETALVDEVVADLVVPGHVVADEQRGHAAVVVDTVPCSRRTTPCRGVGEVAGALV